MGASSDDWRHCGQERYLHGAALVRRTWVAPRPDWDHDHCEFCNAKFSERAADLNEGWATEDSSRWVCDACYADFRAEFEWPAAAAESG